MTCPERGCDRVSVTFDPFTVLSIPLPCCPKKLKLTLLFKNGRRPAAALKVACTASRGRNTAPCPTTQTLMLHLRLGRAQVRHVRR